MIDPRPFTVQVPASTSNLGPGFDVLGLAVSLDNTFRFRALERGCASRLTGAGTAVTMTLVGNPLAVSMQRVAEVAGRALPPVEIAADCQTPLGAGLGSSGMLAVAGALGANRLLGDPLSPEVLLGLLVEAEGHPDNVSPSLLGGLTVSTLVDGAPLTHVYAAWEGWRLVALVPDYTLATAKARKALPREVRLRNAVHNMSRLPFVVESLVSGDAAQLTRVMEDRLHEKSRGRRIKRYERLREAAREAGADAVFISGAGPAVIALCAGDERVGAVAAAMLTVCEGAKFTARALHLRVRNQGARVGD